ncbi:MAG: hypothetical protein KatS3mg032_1119 [Cyclobacteriaceae bacterium]|nr:MAG: hypothetical protein KatS3mg032_1119 [Cyclobacteriaceae bacterium]
MKPFWKYIVRFLRNEWFLFVVLVLIFLIVLLFEFCLN